MQLQFSSDEFHLLTDVLEQRDRELKNEISRTANDDFKHRLEKLQRLVDDVEQKLARGEPELRADELDLLGEVVDQCERGLTAEIARTEDREFRHLLQQREELLRPVHDKVVELCEMF
jgi:DNA-nicking Smr family endonuclease